MTIFVVLLAVTAPASAHPFGPPQTARATVDGNRVELVWQAAEDDWVVLGEQLGAFRDATGAVATNETGQQKLAKSPKVRAYLLDKIRVKQAGRACRGAVQDLSDVLARGAKLRFECPDAVGEIELTIGMLVDLNPLYRTVLTTESPKGPRQALFNDSSLTRAVTFAPGGGGTFPTTLVIAGGLVGSALLAGVAIPLGLRRRRRA
ncbi:hypothetical protein [Tenggerimyces flavus]|uniref:Uncharacterized protein n=1 Tax=Tenggerimyces flavus TaxID=1708749 RepID=A0ABV7YKK1_9ACTN|nr:hypothetical protein [Tenggerimyces flavus]MBM7784790.1 hypothetical protein [Tenggerimyces flavus]